MDAGAIVGLVCLVAIVAAFIIARRRGGKAFTAAIAAADAAGYARAGSDAAASAQAYGNRVDLHFGHGQHYRGDEWSVASAGERGPFDDEDPNTDGLSPAVIRAELRRMDALQRARGVDARGMGELLERLQHGPDAIERDHRALDHGGARNGDVPADRDPATVSHPSWGGE